MSLVSSFNALPKHSSSGYSVPTRDPFCAVVTTSDHFLHADLALSHFPKSPTEFLIWEPISACGILDVGGLTDKHESGSFSTTRSSGFVHPAVCTLKLGSFLTVDIGFETGEYAL